MDDALRSPVNSTSGTQANQGVWSIELQPCSAVQTEELATKICQDTQIGSA
jgi:hypothetical protein